MPGWARHFSKVTPIVQRWIKVNSVDSSVSSKNGRKVCAWLQLSFRITHQNPMHTHQNPMHTHQNPMQRQRRMAETIPYCRAGIDFQSMPTLVIPTVRVSSAGRCQVFKAPLLAWVSAANYTGAAEFLGYRLNSRFTPQLCLMFISIALSLHNLWVWV